MKLSFSAVLLAASSSLLTLTSVDAAECTQAQLASFGTMASNPDFAKDCASVLGATPSTTAIDASALAGLNPCGNAKCVTFLKNFAATLPACEIAGVSLKTSFDMVFSLCNGKSMSPPTAMPTELPSMNTTESDATTTTTTTTTRPPTSGAGSVKEADTPAPSKTSAASKVVASRFVLGASALFATGAWLLIV